jgi:CHAD domain-containing protein
MERKKIKKVIEDHLKQMQSIAKKISAAYATEDIHSFRIEVKKLRAFLRLIQKVQNLHATHFPKQIKNFYALLGAIRTLQLQQEKIREAIKKTKGVIPEAYLRILHNETGIQIEKANKLLLNKNLFKEKKLVEKLPGKISKAELNNYLSFQKNKLLRLISEENISDRQIHQIRKILKDIFYVHPYIMNKKKNAVNSFFDRKNLKEITDILGNFHDTCVALSLLSPQYLNKIPSQQERDSLPAIHKRLQKERKELKTKIKFKKYQSLLNQKANNANLFPPKKITEFN